MLGEHEGTPRTKGAVMATKKNTPKEPDDEVFLGTGAAGDPRNPAERPFPNQPAPVVPGQIVPDASGNQDDEKDTK